METARIRQTTTRAGGGSLRHAYRVRLEFSGGLRRVLGAVCGAFAEGDSRRASTSRGGSAEPRGGAPLESAVQRVVLAAAVDERGALVACSTPAERRRRA